MFKKMVLLTILIVLFLTLTCMTNAAIPKDTLVIGVLTGGFSTNDPGVTYYNLSDAFNRNMYARLVDVKIIDKEYITVPDLAESWEIAPDGKTWTFYLRKGLVFANNDPLKADAVVYSFKRVLKINLTPSYLFTNIIGLTEEGIVALDDYTVRIITNGAPSNIVLTVLANSLAGILNPKIVKEHEIEGDMGQAWLVDHSAGAGPYILKEWSRNEKLILIANEKYWRGAPRIKTIILTDIPESSDQLLTLKKGDIDIAWDLTAEQANSLKDSTDTSVIVNPFGQSNFYIGMNADWGPFKDVRVRQAVKYAIDYNALIDKIMAGFAINNQQFTPAGYFGYVENNPYNYDIEKAKKLMAEAGYSDGFDVELLVPLVKSMGDQAIVIQDNMAKIGIKVKINLMQGAQFIEKFRKQGFQMCLSGWTSAYPDLDANANAFANYRVKSIAWYMGWYDDYAADLCELAGKEINEDKRLQIYQDLTNYWHVYSPVAIMFQRANFWGVRNNIKGFDKAIEGYGVHLDLTEIYK